MSEKELERKYIRRLFVVIALYYLVANFVHPVSPTFYKMLQLPDYMFGVAFACMMVTNFIFSPFWGNAARQIGTSKALSICLCGYAFGQFLFAMSQNSLHIGLARAVSGIFAGGMEVCFILYNIEHSDDINRGSNLAKAATITAVANAFGYMIGGVIGDISVKLDMFTQVGCLLVLAVLLRFVLKDNEKGREKKAWKQLVHDSNPLASFMKAKGLITASLMIFLIMALCTNFGSTSYDQSFNYYIRDQYGFPPSYNGLLKGAVGLITLLMNSTVCLYILRHTNIYRSIIYVFAILSIMLIGIIKINRVVPFIILNVVFFGFNAVYKPLLQNMISSHGKENAGLLIGLYNSMLSIGSVCGALIAGFLYKVGPRYPFVCSFIMFVLATIFALIQYKKRERESHEGN